MRRLVAVALGLTLGGGLATPSFAQDVDTAPGETGFGITGGWDRWGQTLRAPEGETQLDVFSFYVYTQAPLTFTAGIYRWDGATLGASLWSTERTLSGAGRGWESFATGGLVLDPALTYAAFLTPAAPDAGAYAGIGYLSSPYGGGLLVLGEESGTTLTQFTGLDAAFRADFSAAGSASVAPEPVSMALLGTGLAGVGALRRRRRKGAASA